MINGATKSIEVLAYSLDGKIWEALKRRKQAGIDVLVTADKKSFMMKKDRNLFVESQQFFGGEYFVIAEGWSNRDVLHHDWPGGQHVKLIIVDGKRLVMGSFNFTESAANSYIEALLEVLGPPAPIMEVREFFNDIRCNDLTKKRLDPDKFDKYGNRQTGNEDFTGKVYCLDMQGKLFPSNRK